MIKFDLVCENDHIFERAKKGSVDDMVKIGTDLNLLSEYSTIWF